MGKVRYVADLSLPDSLHGRVLRSPYPHAVIKSISITAAKALPGVVGVFTHQDIPGKNAFGRAIADQEVLCSHKARYFGDAVALVAAINPETAAQALKLIEVDYEKLPAVFDPREAMLPDAPLVHDHGNLLTHIKIRKGDVEEGFQQAVEIIENNYRTPFVDHLYLEPEGALAAPNPDGGIKFYGVLPKHRLAYAERLLMP